MTIAFVQGLLSGTNKATASTLTVTGSKSLTVGNMVFIGYAHRATGTITYSAADDLGNSYPTISSSAVNNAVSTVLLGGIVTVGGTVTSINIDSTVSYTAAAAISVEFSGVGAVNATGLLRAASTNLNAYPGTSTTTTAAQTIGDLWVGSFAWQSPVVAFTMPVAATSGVAASQPIAAIGTSGQASGSNCSVAFGYFICDANTSNMLNGGTASGISGAAAGADFVPAAAAPSLLWKPNRGPNYRR